VAADARPTAGAVSAVVEAPLWALQRLDATGTVLHAEGRVREIFGIGVEEMVGSNVSTLLHPDDQPLALGMWLEVLGRPGETRSIRQRILRPDGTVAWVESTVVNRLDG